MMATIWQEMLYAKDRYRAWADDPAVNLGGDFGTLSRGDVVDLGLVAAVSMFGVWLVSDAWRPEEE